MAVDAMQPNPKRVHLSVEELLNLPREELVSKWKEQDSFIDHLENKKKYSSGDAVEEGAPDLEEKLKQQQMEAARRENILVMRLTTKEQELQDLISQISELKQVQITNSSQLRGKLLDPAVNLMFQRMKKEMEQAKDKMEQTQNELSAWKFTPDSQTGKRLMAKCRMLLQENEELGKVISSGRTAKLESDIALERKLIEEMKSAQQETDEFLGELDEDVEGMQSTIYLLQKQLKEAKDQTTQYEQLLAQHGLQLQPQGATVDSSELFRTSKIEAGDVRETQGSSERVDRSVTPNGDIVMETDDTNDIPVANSYESTKGDGVIDQRTSYVDDSDTWSPEPCTESSELSRKESRTSNSDSNCMETETVTTNGLSSPKS